MMDLPKLQLLAQLVDNIEISTEKLEKAYENKDSEDFNNCKSSILDFQRKIIGVLRGG